MVTSSWRHEHTFGHISRIVWSISTKICWQLHVVRGDIVSDEVWRHIAWRHGDVIVTSWTHFRPYLENRLIDLDEIFFAASRGPGHIVSDKDRRIFCSFPWSGGTLWAIMWRHCYVINTISAISQEPFDPCGRIFYSFPCFMPSLKQES